MNTAPILAAGIQNGFPVITRQLIFSAIDEFTFAHRRIRPTVTLIFGRIHLRHHLVPPCGFFFLTHRRQLLLGLEDAVRGPGCDPPILRRWIGRSKSRIPHHSQLAYGLLRIGFSGNININLSPHRIFPSIRSTLILKRSSTPCIPADGGKMGLFMSANLHIPRPQPGNNLLFSSGQNLAVRSCRLAVGNTTFPFSRFPPGNLPFLFRGSLAAT